MKARGRGHIVNVPSNVEFFNSQDVLAYCGTKTGFNKMLQGLQAGNKNFIIYRENTYLSDVKIKNLILFRVEND